MNMSEIACEYPCVPAPFAEKTLKLCVSVKYQWSMDVSGLFLELGFNALVHVYSHAIEASTSLLAAFIYFRFLRKYVIRC